MPTPNRQRGRLMRPFDLPEALADFGERLDMLEYEARAIASREAPLVAGHLLAAALPASVDHSVHVKFIRHQGAYGCGMNAAANCWDILLAKYCAPYIHPNISVNRMLWAWEWTLRMRTPIPGLGGASYPTQDAYLNGLGCPTEGTELTDSDATKWPTDAGNLECPNYRMGRHPQAVAPAFHHDVKVDLAGLKYWLNGGPVRAGVWGNHFVALVGYDDNTQRLKFVNSWGDRWGEDGFGYIDYGDASTQIDSAQVYQFVRPKPMPVARVRFTSQWRQGVNLWIGVEGTAKVRRIWPSGQRQDNSRNLWLTVALPPATPWPPGPQNRLYLDVYDEGARSRAGGSILEFSAHSGEDHRFCTEILQGAPDLDQPSATLGVAPKVFTPNTMTRVTIG